MHGLSKQKTTESYQQGPPGSPGMWGWWSPCAQAPQDSSKEARRLGPKSLAPSLRVQEREG